MTTPVNSKTHPDSKNAINITKGNAFLIFISSFREDSRSSY